MGLFYKKLQAAWANSGSLLCVGLDPDPERIPAHIQGERPYFEFCRSIVDSTAPYSCAFKPQAAHFAAAGRETELALLIEYIHTHHPGHVVILDAKRGDVGSTAAFYAREAYGRYGADTVTVSPFLGEESIRPYLEYKERGVTLLCRTSNADSDWLQSIGSPPVFERIAARAVEWNHLGQMMLVAGATYPQELGRIRQIVGDMPFLVPGIGAQGGDLEAVMAQGLDQKGNGLVISSSRGIIYADEGTDFARAAGREAEQTREEINALRP